MSDSAPATAAILTLGCKLNIADSEAMARRLREAGWRVVDRPGGAQAGIRHSCALPPARPPHDSHPGPLPEGEGVRRTLRRDRRVELRRQERACGLEAKGSVMSTRERSKSVE